jgi:hypothetical protein
MRVPVRLNAISPYQSQQSSPALHDITVPGHTRHLRSGHTRHLCSGHARHLRPGHTRLISGQNLCLQRQGALHTRVIVCDTLREVPWSKDIYLCTALDPRFQILPVRGSALTAEMIHVCMKQIHVTNY